MESVQVLRSLGERGWTCRISHDPIADGWVDEVRASGWMPLDITVQPESSQSMPFGQDDVRIKIPVTDVSELLSQRFPPGRPMHQLLAHGIDADLLDTVISSTRPWIVGTEPELPIRALDGYSQVTSRDLTWWVRSDLQYLAPGLTALAQRVRAPLPDRTLLRRVKGRLRPHAVRLAHRLPGPLKGRLARRRHLEAIGPNIEHLIDPAYFGHPPVDRVCWLTPADLPEVPESATTLEPLTPAMIDASKTWLADPHDLDAMLDRRMDNHGDELGRTRAAVTTRVALAGRTPPSLRPLSAMTSGPIVVDARSLQSRAFGTRGIGRFALSAVMSTRSIAGDQNVTLLIDPTLEPLPESITGACATVRCITSHEAPTIGALIQPSPMTANPDPLVPALLAGVPSLAIVYDFIPAHYPTVYLSHPAARSEYASQLDALALYGEYLAISHTTANELADFLHARGRDDVPCEVSWPQAITSTTNTATHAPRNGPIIVMTGDEPRKNTFGALAAVGAATAADRPPRNIAVLGMAGHDIRVHHLSIAAAMRPGETNTLARIDDAELAKLLSTASVVVVASFDEGLSLPVIEALQNGAPVVASDIPAHRELIGAGDHLAPPGDIEALSEAIRLHRGSKATHRQQRDYLQAHQHTSIEHALAQRIPDIRGAQRPERQRPRRVTGPRIAVATPWPPQATGVADFSAATITALQDHADVTVFATSGAGTGEPLDQLPQRAHEFDALIAVAGNSHYHLPILETLARIRSTTNLPTIVIAHDTRMVEYYMALRSKAGAEAVMLRGQHHKRLAPSLDEQIDDMRLLQNAGFWEAAHLADRLILHSVGAAQRIAQETGIDPILLPFANQRVPDHSEITTHMREQARRALGVPQETLFLASFGYADNRTKLTDVVVEAAAWLTQWGHVVSLHLVGAATPELQRSLDKRAQQAGIHDFRITGFADEHLFRQYLLGIDIGVQLRISPLLGVSGPLSDMAAFGTRAVASRGLAIDVDAPDYIHRLPDNTSPLLVAEAIERQIRTPLEPDVREHQRRAYLVTKTPQEYAAKLAVVVEELLS